MAPNEAAATAADMLTRDFLAWLSASPRTNAEVMAAWRTSCPRLAIWEDALAGGLVRVETELGEPAAVARVTLTACGRAVLDGRPRWT